MLFSWIKGIIGNYLGVQRSKEFVSIVEDAPSASVENVLQIPAVWQCVTLICNTFKSLPINVIRIDKDDKRTIDKNHYLYQLLNYEPNQEMTPSEFKSTM